MKTWSRGTNSRQPFGVNVNLNLSNIQLSPEGEVLALLTDPEGDSCFSIYQISWIKLKKVTFCKLKT